MSDEHDNSRTWLERLSHALLREPRDREQLIELLHDAKERELLNADALQMIKGVLEVSEMQVRDVMIPRPQMVVIEHDATLEEILPIIIEAGHSRYPVIGDSRDEILGILLAKDLLPYQGKEKPKEFQIKKLLRPAMYIPESKRLDVLLKEFRLNRNHMAIVVDEYGGAAGLATIEDVLEQIVGEIEDEYDTTEEERFIRMLNETECMVKALTPIEDFNAYFKTNFSDEDFDTIGGLVLQKFSHLPKRGESTVLEGIEFVVTSASSRGIQLLKIKIIPQGE